MKFISGKKLSMTQVWNEDKVIGVTPVAAGPCVITQVKTKARDGYEALQLAYGERKEKNIKKPQLGHVKNLNIKPAHLREFRTDQAGTFKVGDIVTVGTFKIGDIVNVTATSKGKGFQGVVKRHHFHGFRKTHGNKDQERMGGSIGPKGPAHVFKGMRMGGRMGGARVTTTNLEIIKVDEANNILFVKGAVPGAINGLVLLAGVGDLQVNLQTVVPATPEVVVEAGETPAVKPVTEAVPEEAPVETPVEEKAVEPKTAPIEPLSPAAQ